MTEQDISLQERPSLLLGIGWVLTFSPVLPFTLAIALLAEQLDLDSDRILLFWLVLASALICAVLIGFSQRFVLHRYINIRRQWVLATASGVGILWPLAIGVFFATESLPIPNWPAQWEEIGRWGWSIAWVTTGVAQYLLLKEHWRRAGWWILANTIAGIAGLLLGSFVSNQLSPGRWWPELRPNLYAPPEAWIEGITVAVITAGACTGIALIWMLRQQRPS